MVVYADVLLVLNWWIDFLLLLGVRRALGAAGKNWRLVLGALVGACFSLTLLLPPLPVWLSMFLNLVAAVIMVVVAFAWRGFRRCCHQILLLFGFSTGLAGVCGALYTFVAPTGFYVFNGQVYYDLPPLIFVSLTVVFYLLLSLVDRLYRRRAPAEHSVCVRVYYGNRQVDVRCLYDSGNHLVEPFSNHPVMVLERVVAELLLPVPDGAEDIEPFNNPGWRLVPFDSLGGHGVLPAFIPKQVVMLFNGKEQPLGPCYVAVAPRLHLGEHQGLLGSGMGEAIGDRR